MAHRLNTLVASVQNRAKSLSYFGLLSLIESLILVVCYFLALRMLIQNSGVEYAGLWSLTMGFVSLIRVLDLTGAAGLARMVALADGNDRLAAEYIDTLGIIVLVLYVAIALAAVLPLQAFFNGYLEPEMSTDGLSLLLIALCALPINIVSSAHLAATDGVGRADVRVFLNIGAISLFLALTWALLPTYGILGMAYAQVGQFVVALIGARMFLVSQLQELPVVPRRFSKRAARETLTFGAKLQLSSVPMAIFDPMSRILLGRVAGLEFLSYYDVAYKLAGYTRNLVRAYLTPLLPELSRLITVDVEAARSELSRISSSNMKMVSLLYAAIVLLAPFFSLFMFSEIAVEFLLFTAVLSLGWGLTTFALPTQIFARAANVLRWSILGQWSMLVLSVPLVLVTAAHLDDVFIPICLAAVIFSSHAFSFVAEVRTLQLAPFRSLGHLLVWAGMMVVVCLALVIYSFGAMK